MLGLNGFCFQNKNTHFKFFLSSLVPLSIALFLAHYALMLIQVTKSAYSVGAWAMMHQENGNRDECKRRPVVHSLLERMAHVLGEIHHVALTLKGGRHCILHSRWDNAKRSGVACDHNNPR